MANTIDKMGCVDEFIVAEELNGYFILANESVLEKVKTSGAFTILGVIDQDKIDKTASYGIRNFHNGLYLKKIVGNGA